MGKFSDGYSIGLQIQTGKMTEEEYGEELKNLLKFCTYNECKEWYYGFHEALLQVDLSNLENAFLNLKEHAEKERKDKKEND